MAGYVQMKGNIVNCRQGMYREKISSRFWEIYHLIECHISLWPDFALSTVFFYLCFYERQADKPAWPISWLGSCDRKYCRMKASWKNFEPFWRNTTSKIVIPSEYRPEHVTFGLLCVIFKFPSRIFCRRVPGFATDCPCGVWCRGLTTCLLYVGPPLEF